MAKRRKKKKSSKCPEPFNTLIDITAGLTMGAVADHMEKKYHYKKKGKINPYTVSAYGLASGRMKSTEDILRTGAFLGAMGSFDIDTSDPDALHSQIKDDPIFYNIPNAKVNDNRYAWRLNCEDGSAYGIYPEDYETREEYHKAIERQKYAWRECCEDGSELGVNPDDYETEDEYEEALEEARKSEDSFDVDDVSFADYEACDEIDDDAESKDDNEYEDNTISAVVIETKHQEKSPDLSALVSDPFETDDFHVYVYCFVEIIGCGVKRYYRTEDRTLKKGDTVLVPDQISGNAQKGIILTIEHHMRFSVPQPVKETLQIIARTE